MALPQPQNPPHSRWRPLLESGIRPSQDGANTNSCYPFSFFKERALTLGILWLSQNGGRRITHNIWPFQDGARVAYLSSLLLQTLPVVGNAGIWGLRETLSGPAFCWDTLAAEWTGGKSLWMLRPPRWVWVQVMLRGSEFFSSVDKNLDLVSSLGRPRPGLPSNRNPDLAFLGWGLGPTFLLTGRGTWLLPSHTGPGFPL